MQFEECKGLMEVARETGIPYYRIIYAENAGWLPAPRRVANKRLYMPADIARIREFFARKEKHDESSDALREVPGQAAR